MKRFFLRRKLVPLHWRRGRLRSILAGATHSFEINLGGDSTSHPIDKFLTLADDYLIENSDGYIRYFKKRRGSVTPITLLREVTSNLRKISALKGSREISKMECLVALKAAFDDYGGYIERVESSDTGSNKVS